MKVVILAGGFGTRLSEYTDMIPKPMVQIGGIPIIIHLMNYFSKFGHNEFIIALGYKADYVKDYFSRYHSMQSDYTLDIKDGSINYHNKNVLNWKVSLINTGLNSMTGGRIKRLKNLIGNEQFFMTYGDGLCDVNLSELLNFHNKSKNIVTVTAVHPIARFGELIIDDDNNVSSFKEKPQVEQGYINGGFFVMEPSFINFIDDDNSVLEKEPLERAVSKK
jgi:glucose-1-phosphate cytidylyltransferase